MPQYMLLSSPIPARARPRARPRRMAEWQAWGTYTQGLKDAGAFVSGEPLEPPTTATTVAMRNGDRVVTDGPFAETKEWLGGYYVIEAPDLDAALDHASRHPQHRLRPRRGAPGDAGPRGCEQRRRARLSRGVRPRPRHADPPPGRRLPAGRGRAPGRVRRRAGHLAARRRARESRAPGSPPRRGARRSIACAASAPSTTACPPCTRSWSSTATTRPRSPTTSRLSTTTACASSSPAVTPRWRWTRASR